MDKSVACGVTDSDGTMDFCKTKKIIKTYFRKIEEDEKCEVTLNKIITFFFQVFN